MRDCGVYPVLDTGSPSRSLRPVPKLANFGTGLRSLGLLAMTKITHFVIQNNIIITIETLSNITFNLFARHLF